MSFFIFSNGMFNGGEPLESWTTEDVLTLWIFKSTSRPLYSGVLSGEPCKVIHLSSKRSDCRRTVESRLRFSGLSTSLKGRAGVSGNRTPILDPGSRRVDVPTDFGVRT